MESITKFGIRPSFNYVFYSKPSLLTEYFLDIPFAKTFSGLLSVGLQKIVISKYSPTETNTYEGSGEINYLVFTGLMKLYLKSMYIGAGLKYFHFLNGNIRPKDMGTPDYKLYYIVDKDDINPDINVVAAWGYLAELRDNIFLTPEVMFVYCLPPWQRKIVPGDNRMMINIGVGLSFKL
jgi:hypothetical protein